MTRFTLFFSASFVCLLTILAAPSSAQLKGLFGKSRKAVATPAKPADSTSSEPSQEDVLAAGINDTLNLSSEALPDLGLDIDKQEKEKQKKETKKKAKVKKNVFWGLKTRKGFTKVGKGDRVTIELFHTLKKYKDPDPYVRKVYWYDRKNKKITTEAIKDKATAQILHGPYKKYAGGKVIEEGFFHLGARHGRWEKYKLDNTLVDKVKFRRGLPKEAEITYFDPQRTKIKEVIPKENGVIKGDYLRYYDGGQLECEGRYDNGVKVGRWLEYYQFKRQRKKEMQYGKDAFDTKFEPVTIREWDETGNVLLDRERGIDNLANRGKETPVKGNRGNSKKSNPKTASKRPPSKVPVVTTEENKSPELNSPVTDSTKTEEKIEEKPEEKTNVNTTTVTPSDSTSTVPGVSTPGPKKFDNKTRPGAPKRKN